MGSMQLSWDERIARFWATADDSDPARMLSAMRMLVGERAPDDPDAICRHDDALRVALLALAPTLPFYGRAISSYAEELTSAAGSHRGVEAPSRGLAQEGIEQSMGS